MSGEAEGRAHPHLEERRAVWEALSMMYLDADVASSREWRIAALAASPYSPTEMDAILRDEVHPVCFPNLLSPAGEWSGFDPVWLEQAIRNRRNGWGSRLLAAISRTLPVAFPREEWEATRQGVIALRRGAGPPQR
ncbi:DUF7079 family protein [Azospirillum picis]|uniref:DUF7079 domain-containing protein n=1 Tax=Azospirillum picis TaxID=488438 RepID=A0ABU0MMW7_9PROT|nr:hypothetical protein [Azospirillum picis]MBP2301240.1 hypothetical protein [Azospirillum picis]MDQ0534797.1 hypothetical protein [Azospirillum picis]